MSDNKGSCCKSQAAKIPQCRIVPIQKISAGAEKVFLIQSSFPIRYANNGQVLSPISIANPSRVLPAYYKRVTATVPGVRGPRIACTRYQCKVTYVHSLVCHELQGIDMLKWPESTEQLKSNRIFTIWYNKTTNAGAETYSVH